MATTYDLTSQTPSRFRTGDVLNCPFSGNPVSITLPKGVYRLECWGAYGPYSSSSPSNTHANGYGGYAAGTLKLKNSLTIYIYTGGKPPESAQNGYYYGGWNGGGSKKVASSYNDNGCGGGATDICLVRSDVSLDSYYRYVRSSASYLSRLIVAGGGGGGRKDNEVSQGGYCPVSTTENGSYHGGLTAAGSNSDSNAVAPGFGFGGSSIHTSDDRGAGGGGWYGGACNGDSYGGGGSSFVWCDTYKSYAPSGYSVSESYLLTDPDLQLGSSKANPAGSTSNGYCRITVLTFPAFAKVGGSWKSVSAGYTKVGGVWKKISPPKTKVNGAWK